ncbi:zinc finger protein 184-like isoform X2 [Nylanderia fulva]|uniref:zinc finger protein 184-like isoform X2 n=1 Tax=Nylanderia fulva TaxID=613905 RepID=UPI0010FB3DEF|nr:zinc finger protein 184-like isoform X2 [Nylanderia fulva]
MGYTEEDSDSVASDLQNKHDIYIEIEQDKKKYECIYTGCHAVFLRPSRLQRHIRTHTGERPYKCDYPECTKAYTNSCHLKRHLETHNSMKKIYQCPQCSMSISYLHNLKRHYKQMHNKDKKIFCKECGESFSKKNQLAEHETIHFGSITYKCDKCVKSFTNITKFKQHKKAHEKPPKCYPCPVSGCSEVFDKWLLLCAHRRAKHVTTYKCNNCDKSFLSKSRLRIHSRIHSENRLVVSCPYDNCHKTYLFKYSLEQHIRATHLEEKFYCDMCSVGLTTKKKLIEHIQRRHELKKQKTSKKEQRKKRKDAGIPKKSVLSGLMGVNLPYNLEKMVMERETVITTDNNVDIYYNTG